MLAKAKGEIGVASNVASASRRVRRGRFVVVVPGGSENADVDGVGDGVESSFSRVASAPMSATRTATIPGPKGSFRAEQLGPSPSWDTLGKQLSPICTTAIPAEQLSIGHPGSRLS
jgi:hypothetical protein